MSVHLSTSHRLGRRLLEFLRRHVSTSDGPWRPRGGEALMPGTPFPTSPSQVAALTVAEFARGLDCHPSVSLDEVCQLFLDDTNRAVVWFIRFRALTAWRERADIAAWLRAEPAIAGQICEVAASFALNADWEFDANSFRSAVEANTR